MLERAKWALMFFLLCAGGVFYLFSSNEWVMVEKAMSETAAQEDDSLYSLPLETMDGNQVTLGNFQGERLFVFFFTTWCHVCQEQWKEVKEVQGGPSADKIKIIAVNLTKEDRNKSEIENYVRQTEPGEIDVLLDTEGKAQKEFKVMGIPTSIIIDEKGQVMERTDGLMSAQKINEKIEAWTKESP
ncbi:TlpA family protein disulfide reductase [Salipaludibacillus aurantiacus]|uniref:Cytochrome oxidase Cu insertion factor, SCO1/SenC/PrrC family n=1 Tax=Salipaludibacillus aurantiacus TaxID=1601833 RepID=A0A1H9TD31_9BACI|nr:TlpA disulfide reductase family protein [Salipaludibacillus aurantiacus]SER94844.1 Cytochrome oxidase Cu insertion factor, SCO1/SenC/PrrC family [Salipaludibacillus aurantiacus]